MGVKLPPHRQGNSNLFAAIARKAIELSGARQMASDAAWSATHPIDRLMGRGRAQGRPFILNGKLIHLSSGEVPMYGKFPVDRAKSLGVSGANIRTVAGLQAGQGVHAMYELSQPVDTILGNIRKQAGKRVRVVDPGGKAWGDAVGGASGTGEFTRHPVLIGPNGRVYISAKPGYHHDDVARAAGLPGDWPQRGFFQADLKAGIPDMDVPPSFSVGGWMDAPPTRQHAYGVARLKNAIKGAGASIRTSH